MSCITYKVDIYEDGTEKWFNQDGQYHREDGPAVVWLDGSEFWYKNGKQHREDGPAVIRKDGLKQWYKNGKLHREEGPASVCPPNSWTNGFKKWCKNGKLHREDGPAIIYSGGEKEWFLNGIQYSEQEFLKETSEKSDLYNGKTVEIDGKKYVLTLCL